MLDHYTVRYVQGKDFIRQRHFGDIVSAESFANWLHDNGRHSIEIFRVQEVETPVPWIQATIPERS